MNNEEFAAMVRAQQARTRQADWGNYSAWAESRWPWLAHVKARWNVILYRLTFPLHRKWLNERHGLYPLWYDWLWWD